MGGASSRMWWRRRCAKKYMKRTRPTTWQVRLVSTPRWEGINQIVNVWVSIRLVYQIRFKSLFNTLLREQTGVREMTFFANQPRNLKVLSCLVKPLAWQAPAHR